MMSNIATFTLHIINIVKKARDKMGWVLRVFQSRKRSLILTPFISLVIPLLEYYCQLWNPWKAKDIQAIKAIQRTFTYKITEVQHLNYWERLHELKLYSLRRRRERYIIIYILPPPLWLCNRQSVSCITLYRFCCVRTYKCFLWFY